jgi:N-acetylneuraminic acid mutarotase
MSQRRSVLVGLPLVWLASVFGAVWLGAELMSRWPLESVEERLRLNDNGWAPVSEVPSDRYESMVTRVGSDLYVFGGYDRALTALPGAWRFDLISREWERVSDLPEAFSHSTAALSRGQVWFAGGVLERYGGPVVSTVRSFDLRTRVWTDRPQLPEPRSAGVLVSVGDTLHFFGGFEEGSGNARTEHWLLAPDEARWESASPMPAPRGHHSGVVVGRAVLLIGGIESHIDSPQDRREVFLYDLDAESWITGPSLPFGLSHAESSTIADDQRVMVVGGRSLERFEMASPKILSLQLGDDAWSYVGELSRPIMGGVAAITRDTILAGIGLRRGTWGLDPTVRLRPMYDSWSRGTAAPVALGEVAAGVIDNRMCLVGEGSSRMPVLDLASGLWEPSGERSRRPLGGHHHAAEVVGGRLFLIGGLGGWAANVAGSVQIYDPAGDAWTMGPRMPYAAGSVASVEIDGRIYVAGGIVADSTTRQAAVLDPVSMTWSRLPDMPLGRNHAAAGTDGRRFFIFGGRGPGSGDGNVVADGFAEVQVFDPSTNQWASTLSDPDALPPIPQHRGGMGKAVYVDGEFWVIGGETLTGSSASRRGTYARVDIFDPLSATWRRGPDLGVGRHGIFPVYHNAQVFVVGGGTRSGLSASSVVEMIRPRRRTVPATGR